MPTLKQIEDRKVQIMDKQSMIKLYSYKDNIRELEKGKRMFDNPDIHFYLVPTLYEPVGFVSSESQPGLYYFVEPDGRCSCPWSRQIHPTKCKHFWTLWFAKCVTNAPEDDPEFDARMLRMMEDDYESDTNPALDNV